MWKPPTIPPSGTDLRIRVNSDRRRRLEASAAEAKVILSQHETVKDEVEDIAVCARDMTEFLKESELPERMAFVESFVSEILVMPGKAIINNSIPVPADSQTPGTCFDEVSLSRSAR